MKRYKVEGLIYYTKVTLDMDHIVTTSVPEIQAKLDQYARDGWRLASTDAIGFGFAVYVYLYFESDTDGHP